MEKGGQSLAGLLAELSLELAPLAIASEMEGFEPVMKLPQISRIL